MTIFDVVIDGRSYDQFDAGEKAAFEIHRAFTSPERDWFERHWLRCTGGDVAAVNEALPSSVNVMALTDGTYSYLGSDLLTDCGAGGTYEDAGELLRAYAVVEWTVPSDEP